MFVLIPIFRSPKNKGMVKTKIPDSTYPWMTNLARPKVSETSPRLQITRFKSYLLRDINSRIDDGCLPTIVSNPLVSLHPVYLTSLKPGDETKRQTIDLTLTLDPETYSTLRADTNE